MINKKIPWKKIWAWSSIVWLLGSALAPNDTVGIIFAIPLGISLLTILDILISLIPWVKGRFYKKGILCALLSGILMLTSFLLLLSRPDDSSFIAIAFGILASIAQGTVFMTLFYFIESFLHTEWVS